MNTLEAVLSPARQDEKRLAAYDADAPLRPFVRSWLRKLRQENRSPRTLDSYAEGVRMLDRFLVEKGMPRTIDGIRREHLEDFVIDQAERHSPATALTRYHSLRAFFRYLVDQEELTRSPMEKMKPATVPPPVMRVLSEEELERLLATCAKGKTFDERRDYAMLMTLLDCGLRRNELAEVTLDDLDLDRSEILIPNPKGGRPRTVAFGNATADAIERYLRKRETHPKARRRNGEPEPALWLGKVGPIKRGGVAFIVDKRAEQAGIGKVHPHTFRHSFAHHWLAGGGSEGDLMRLTGWRSREMLDRYASSTAASRARDAHSRFGLGDRLRTGRR